MIRVVQYRPTRSRMADSSSEGRSTSSSRKTAAAVVVDGGQGLGPVQATSGCSIGSSALAERCGLAAGTLRNCAAHRSARRIRGSGGGTQDGLPRHRQQSRLRPRRRLLPAAPSSHASAPIRSRLGVPTNADPVVLDIGTSVVAEGKVRVLFNKGQKVPEGWLASIPMRNRPTDPGVLYKEPRGSILPLGGPQAYKGFGIGLVLDMLVGGFSGAPCSTPGLPNMSGNGVFFLVLDIDQFAGAKRALSARSERLDAERQGMSGRRTACRRSSSPANRNAVRAPSVASRASRSTTAPGRSFPHWRSV